MPRPRPQHNVHVRLINISPPLQQQTAAVAYFSMEIAVEPAMPTYSGDSRCLLAQEAVLWRHCHKLVL